MNSPTLTSSSTLFGHPKGLYILFMTEVWERFGYYGMRALFILYLTKYLLYSDSSALSIFGAYFTLIHALPVLGGFMADNYMGYRNAIITGAILMLVGQCGMALIDPMIYNGSDAMMARDPWLLQAFYLSMACTAVGVGFLKPNISIVVGALYPDANKKRDAGFTIFYTGISLGAMSAAVICGYVGEVYGWHYGFGLSAIGILIGLMTFLLGQKYLRSAYTHLHESRNEQNVINTFWKKSISSVLVVVIILMTWQFLINYLMVGIALLFTIVILTTYIFYYALFKCTTKERDRIIVIMVLTFFMVVFFALMEQAGGSLVLFADRMVDRNILGVDILASQFQALNPTFVMLGGLFYGWFWIFLERKQYEISTPMKFACGIVQAGLGFCLLAFSLFSYSAGGLVSPVPLILTSLLVSSGELWIAPTALSMVTKLAPPRICGLMMGALFMSLAGAGFIAAQIARIFIVGEGGEVDQVTQAGNFYELFKVLAALSVGLGLLLLLLVRPLRRRMHGIH